MTLPAFRADGSLPPGIHAASLQEVTARFRVGTPSREQTAELLVRIVEAATAYPSMKRVLVWGSFVTAKPEPNDLDYSIIVSVEHAQTAIDPEHRRFFVPFDAKLFYGADTGYLLVEDYPIETYADRLEFMCQRKRIPCGVVEISLRGERSGGTT
jgi:hypothetical protein